MEKLIANLSKEVIAMARHRQRLAGALLLGLAAGFLLLALWIPSKALLAQYLLERSWAQASAHSDAPKPWPWADTHPVAKIRAANLGVEQIVLSGDSGRVLAFGPGWTQSSAAPGAIGTSIISGHRDTHFSWLQKLQDGDLVELESVSGLRRYRVNGSAIVDARYTSIDVHGGEDQLLLITCWPFDALVSGGPERYVVNLVPETLSKQLVANR